jgi:hypothetical protein
MTIDPRVGMWISIVAAIISALVAVPAEFTNVFGTQNASVILGVLGLINTVILAINAVLHAIPSQNTPAAAAQFPLGPKQ